MEFFPSTSFWDGAVPAASAKRTLRLLPRVEAPTEVSLQHSKALLQCVIDTIPDLIFVKDRSGRFLLTNRALERSCGHLEGRKASDIFDARRARDYDEEDHEVLRTGATVTIEEIIPIDGEDRLFQTVKVPWIVDGELAGIAGVSRDITEREQAERALRISESLNRTIVEASSDGILLLDLEGRVVFANRRAGRALGLADEAAFIGRRWTDLLAPHLALEANRAIKAARKGREARFDALQPDGEGAEVWWDIVVTAVTGAGSPPANLVVVSRDLTHQKLSEERVRWVANHDPLTKLPNRSLFQERLDQAIGKCAEGQCGFGLLLLDVDDFKRINDTLGHDCGDALLCTFASRLAAVTRSDSDMVARLGGDEFAVILASVATDEQLDEAVNRIMGALRDPCVHEGKLLDCHASIGASLYPHMGATKSELMKNADVALYAAKEAGKGAVRIFEPAMRSEMQSRNSMLALAQNAIDRNLIVPFYQPKLNLRTGRLDGFEALLRWQHPQRGVQLPSTLEAAFKDPMLAADISDRMIELVLRDAQSWLEADVPFGHVAINAAAAEFRRGNFGERLLEQLHAAAIPTSCIQLEVTETVFLGRGAEYVERALKTLSAAGVRIALDDFGTGYASLSHLKQFPVDIIKIDRSFIRDLQDDPENEAIVRAVIGLSKSLHIAVVAEGVENPVQSAYLRKYDCDYGQGYLFSAAQPADLVPGMIRKFNARAARLSATAEHVRTMKLDILWGRRAGDVEFRANGNQTLPSCDTSPLANAR